MLTYTGHSTHRHLPIVCQWTGPRSKGQAGAQLLVSDATAQRKEPAVLGEVAPRMGAGDRGPELLAVLGRRACSRNQKQNPQPTLLKGTPGPTGRAPKAKDVES